MSKLFDFLKSASKAIDDVESAVSRVENAVNKVAALAEDMAGSPAPDTAAPADLKSADRLILQYAPQLKSFGGEQHEFDAYMYSPPFHVTYTLPNAADYKFEGDYGAGEIYEGYSFGGYETANLLFVIDCGTHDTEAGSFLQRYSRINGPMTLLDSRAVNGPCFERRIEMANEKAHEIIYVHGSQPGNWLFAECQIDKTAVDEKTAAQLMKDFEDMAASVQYTACKN